MGRLERSAHTRGCAIAGNDPDAAVRPVLALITITQDPERTGHDLQRSMDFIREIITADVLDRDHTVVLRVQAPDLERLNEITRLFRRQSAVLSLEVSTMTSLLVRRHPRHTMNR